MISFDDFKKVEITVGKILSAEKIPDSDKLLKLSVDFGVLPPPSAPPQVGGEEKKRDIRQIVSGIALSFPDPSVLVGKRCMFVTNLEPRVIRGYESNGMILTVSTDLPAEAPASASHAGGSAQVGDGSHDAKGSGDGTKFSLLEPQGDILPCTKAK